MTQQSESYEAANMKRMDKKHCAGCHDDFYNGHNDLGVSECWSLKDAKLAPRVVIHRDQRPPYKDKPVPKPTCWRGQASLIVVAPEALRPDGYWR